MSFSRTDAGLCMYHLFVWSNSNLLHISQWITLPTQFCVVLYSLSWSDNKSPQGYRTILSIQADLSNAVAWMVSTCSLIFMFYSPFTKTLGIVPSQTIISVITVTFMFHSYFKFPSKVLILITLFAFFQFYSPVCRDGKVYYSDGSLFSFFFFFFE